MPTSTPAFLRACAILLSVATAMTGCGGTRPDAPAPAAAGTPAARPATDRIRFATFNTSLFSDDAGGLVARLRGDDAAARKIAATIQHVRPDVLLLNEFDHDDAGEAAALFVGRYLGEGQHGQPAIAYPYVYSAPVNTGVPSGLDLDRDGTTAGAGRARGNDAWGYGMHPGQYGMLVLSRFPIDADAVRSFRQLRWSTMPGALAPLDPATMTPHYPADVWAQLRLSSKSHWDLPIDTPIGRIHLLAAHPTPPAFDGVEKRNVLRNHDEIRLWADYLDDAPSDAAWLCDDAGRCGGLADAERFVIAGDYNADPRDGRSLPGAIAQLLEHPRVQRLAPPRSAGAAAAATAATDAFAAHDTAQFGRENLRVDYVLPSLGLPVRDSGVFWPRAGEPGADWLDATDHHLVWIDLAVE